MVRGIGNTIGSPALTMVMATALSGCTPGGSAEDPAASAPTGSERSGVTPAESAASTPTEEGAPSTPAAFPCAPVVLYEPWTSEKPSVSTLGGSRMRIPIDQGPRDHASGDVVLDDAGRPIAYTVAPDDVRTEVADRLCLHIDYLDALNQVRRNRAATLFVGDVLNLDPYAVTSVGSENGVVHDNAPPTPMPPQT